MKDMNRRTFIKQSIKTCAVLGGLSAAPQLMTGVVSASNRTPDISVANGTDYVNVTINAIEQLGGIGKFISSGDRVGILANSGYKKPGTYTNPDVMLTVAYLCLEAGAKDVYCLKNETEKYWRRSPNFESNRKLISRLKADDSDHKLIRIPEAKILKEAKVRSGFLDYDKLINIPIVKDHGEIRITGTLKNIMGISSLSTNVKFHTGPNVVTGFVKELIDRYHNMNHMAQCIADLNSVRSFDLYVSDATKFITTNGPSGPGNIKTLNKVVAGTDRVAVDAYCCRFLDLKPEKQPLILKAFENGLGKMDVSKLSIKES